MAVPSLQQDPGPEAWELFDIVGLMLHEFSHGRRSDALPRLREAHLACHRAWQRVPIVKSEQTGNGKR